MDWSILCAVIGVLTLASLLRSTIGFGDSLAGMPLLALLVGIKVATPLMAIVSFNIGLLILIRRWREVDPRAVWKLLLASLLGIPFGLYLLKSVPEGTIKLSLGLLIASYGLYSLLTPRLPHLDTPWLAYPFGFIAGMFGGAYNLNGPPVVMYASLCRWPPEKFRVNLQGYFVPLSIAIMLSHSATGLWNLQLLKTYLMALPFVCGAVILGGQLNKKIRPGAFDRVVFGLLIVLGLALVF